MEILFNANIIQYVWKHVKSQNETFVAYIIYLFFFLSFHAPAL